MAATWFERALALFRREAADVRESVDELKARADADLTRRERELEATPEERLAALQQEIDSSGDPFADVKAKLDAMRRPPEGDDRPAPPT
jgi:hypothetical protein